jgi:DNA-binding response OmpR family regulator
MSRAPEIIVVDDELDLRLMLKDYLSLQGFRVRLAEGGAELDRHLAEGPADLLVLDVNMPDEDGFAIARRLRAAGRRTGILMLTAAGDVPSRVRGLDGGADDYLAKPVRLRELLARVRSVLRRLEAEPSPSPNKHRCHRFGRCTLDVDARRLEDETGAEVPLTAMEYDLLATFACHPRQVFSRERLSQLAHGRPVPPGDRSVDIRIARLRQRLEPDPSSPAVIHTVRGEGYLYEPGP